MINASLSYGTANLKGCSGVMSEFAEVEDNEWSAEVVRFRLLSWLQREKKKGRGKGRKQIAQSGRDRDQKARVFSEMRYKGQARKQERGANSHIVWKLKEALQLTLQGGKRRGNNKKKQKRDESKTKRQGQ